MVEVTKSAGTSAHIFYICFFGSVTVTSCFQDKKRPGHRTKVGNILLTGGCLWLRHKIKRGSLSFLFFRHLDRAGYLAGAEAPRTDIDVARRTGNHGLYPFDIGLPHSVGTSVGVAHFYAE